MHLLEQVAVFLLTAVLLVPVMLFYFLRDWHEFMRRMEDLVPRRSHQWAVNFAGEAIGGLRPGELARRGIALVPEGRRLFPSLSVEENLLMGTQSGRRGPWNLEAVYSLFGMLRAKRAHPATSLSGGQQQMVAIGRALMANPRLLMCDEISLGLAPIVVKEIYDALPAIVAGGLTMIVVEQDVGLARLVSNRLYCLQEGRVTLTGPSASVTRDDISRAYFGAKMEAAR